jgi:ligand-binding sensor domain-containing protein
VVEDAQGSLWIGTNDAGLIRLQNGAVTQYSVASGLPSNLVFCVIPTPGGEVWACTGNGMARISNGKLIHLAGQVCLQPCTQRAVP